MRVCVIIPAAGVGKRFSQNTENDSSQQVDPLGDTVVKENKNKLAIDLGGKPAILRTVDLFLDREDVGQIILAVNPDAVDDFKRQYGDSLLFHGVQIVPGGRKERWETVQLALDRVNDDMTHIAVHDAARPLASPKLIDRVFHAADQCSAAVPGTPIAPTLRRAAEIDGQTGEITKPASQIDMILDDAEANDVQSMKLHVIGERVERKGLWGMQTPQVFEASLLQNAYKQLGCREDKSGVTDDAELVQSLGEQVYLVEGENTNLKITHPEDAELAQAIFHWRESQKSSTQAIEEKLFKDDDDDLF